MCPALCCERFCPLPNRYVNGSPILKAVRAGVTAYLLKDASALKVIAPIRTIARGEAVCPPQFCLALFKAVAQGGGFSPSLRSTGLRLTRRQQELLPMIACGLTNKEIASHLNLSEQTVKNHIYIGCSARSEQTTAYRSSKSRVLRISLTNPLRRQADRDAGGPRVIRSYRSPHETWIAARFWRSGITCSIWLSRAVRGGPPLHHHQ